MRARLRSALFTIVFTAGTAIAIAAGFVVALFGRRALHVYVSGWTRFHALCAHLILGIRTRVEGALPVGQVLVASKHEAMYETLELVRILGHPAVVAKRELTDFPGWRWVTALYGMVPVDREASAQALRKMLRAAAVAKADGRSFLIFPEGTRVAPGEGPPLRPGFAGLYRSMNLPVVPVALNSGSVWPRHGAKRAGLVTMRFAEPIPPGLPREEIERRVHAAINGLNTDPSPVKNG